MVWFSAGAIIVAGVLAVMRQTTVPVLNFPDTHRYGTVLLALLAAVVASGITFHGVTKENPEHASAARFQTLAEAIPQIVWIADSNGRTTFISRRWYEMTGTKQTESLGTG